MKTIFELKAKIPYDPDTFETVRKAATDLLANAKKENTTQAIVLYCASGKTYRKIIENACSEDKKAEKGFSVLVLFRVYGDLENCHKELYNYEAAYRYSAKRMSLLSAFRA